MRCDVMQSGDDDYRSMTNSYAIPEENTCVEQQLWVEHTLERAHALLADWAVLHSRGTRNAAAHVAARHERHLHEVDLCE